MSNSEEEEVCYFGKPLESYDEDAFPKKRPISVEDQVAKDARGRRRFHGAFTGGFSAGFYNTVGSLEGWKPSEFKSSRSDKAQNSVQNPLDFMDEEDVSEFGIAPHVVKATNEYAQNKKRKKQRFIDGPIPGEPVLDTFLQAGNETVGYFLMKNMNRKHRKAQTGLKVYGCMMPSDLPQDVEDTEYTIHKIYKQYLLEPKSNTNGLSYVGLQKRYESFFRPTQFTVRECNNKKLSIAGQAFGVGAFEDEDEDIYVKDDMSKYDFELTTEKNKNQIENNQKLVFDMFLLATQKVVLQENFPPPVIPSSFSGQHNIKKSRFEPLFNETLPEYKKMNVILRAKHLGENYEKICTSSRDSMLKLNECTKEKILEENKVKNNTILNSLVFDRFVSAKQDDDVTKLLETVKRSEPSNGTSELHAAVKLKMFGPLTRITSSWMPNSLLCKRFNIPELKFEQKKIEKKRTINLIFEYQNQEDLQPEHKPGLSIQKTELPAEIVPSVDTIEEVTDEKEPDILKETSSEINHTERVDVSKNIDLFRIIFLSSDSENDEEEADKKAEEKTHRNNNLKATIITEPLVTKIKPIEKGILSNISFPPSFKEQEKLQVEETKYLSDILYGPKLPSASAKVITVSENVIDNNDEWVEKDSKYKISE